MAIGTGNPAGYVPVYDFGAPRIITCVARDAISGGDLVFLSGAADVCSSGANSFVPKTDLLVADSASGANFTGVAVHNAASGAIISVALDGCAIVRANGTVIASNQVTCDGNNAVLPGVTAGQVVGRALTSASSGGFALVHFLG